MVQGEQMNKEEIKSKMLLLGLNGMAYSSEWNMLAKKLKEMK